MSEGKKVIELNFNNVIQLLSFIALLITISTVVFNTGRVAKTIEYLTADNKEIHEDISDLKTADTNLSDRIYTSEKDIAVLQKSSK